MQIYVQHKDSGLYLRDIDCWSRSRSEAMDFLNSSVAIDFCASHGIRDVHLVLHFEEHNYEIVIPFLEGAIAPEPKSVALGAAKARVRTA